MKRFHVHVAVEDLAASARFYSSIFGAQPTVLKPDYAKWMLDDPRVNFAISQRGIESTKTGVDHLGIQVETDEELQEMHARLAQAELPIEAQVGANCCYAKSDKYWSVDPQGVAWEAYRTLSAIPTYGQSHQEAKQAVASAACCSPVVTDGQRAAPTCGASTKSACC